MSAWLLALLLFGGWAWTPDLDASLLQARYADAAGSRFVEVAGQRLHLRDSGPRDAPAVLLLHGFGASLHSWDEWTEALQDEYRVLRLDLPGAGLSGPDATGDYRDERVLALLTTLLDSLGLQQAVVVGHSMGGRLAWRLAAEHPERVRALVLLAPDGFASPGFEYDKAPEVPLPAHLLPVALPRVLVQRGLAAAWADPARLDEARVQRYHDLLRAPGTREAALDRLRQTRLRDPRPLLARITAPVLLLWGEADAFIPVRHAADYQRALPQARLVVLGGVGHLPQEEAPDRSAAVVREFLQPAAR